MDSRKQTRKMTMDDPRISKSYWMTLWMREQKKLPHVQRNLKRHPGASLTDLRAAARTAYDHWNDPKPKKVLSVQPLWCKQLSLQQQSVLFLAARGPDGVDKWHPAKEVIRYYRAEVMLAARFGKVMEDGMTGDSFMTMKGFDGRLSFNAAVRKYMECVDYIPHHYHMHLLHGVQVLGYKHPNDDHRQAWNAFYLLGCHDLHMTPETEVEMDRRLSDWNQEGW